MNRVTLGEVSVIQNGKTPSKLEQRDAGHPVLKIRDVDENGRFRGVYGSFVDNKFLESYSKKILNQQDILILNSAHSADYIASKIYKAEKLIAGSIATGEWLIIRCNEINLSCNYTYHYLLYNRKNLRKLAKGIHLYPKDVEDFDIPLPSLEVQRRIASILERADRLRRLRQTTLEMSDTYLQSVFLEMFDAGESNKFETITIEETLRPGKNAMRTGPFGSQLLHSEFVDKGIAVLGIDNAVQNRFSWGKLRFITAEKYTKLRRYKVFPKDLIITIMGTTGRCAIVPENIPEAINTKHLCCFSLNLDHFVPEYVQACFLYYRALIDQMGGSERGAIMAGLNMELIKELKIPNPPLELQQKFASIVQRHERLRAQQLEALRQAQHLYDTLLHQAFTGGFETVSDAKLEGVLS